MCVYEMEGVPFQFEIIVQEKLGPKVTGTMYPFFHYDFVMKRDPPYIKKMGSHPLLKL